MAENDKTPLEKLKEAGKDIKDPLFQHYLKHNQIEEASSRLEEIKIEYPQFLQQQVNNNVVYANTYLRRDAAFPNYEAQSYQGLADPNYFLVNPDARISGIDSDHTYKRELDKIDVNDPSSFNRVLENLERDMATLRDNLDGMRNTLPEHDTFIAAAITATSSKEQGAGITVEQAQEGKYRNPYYVDTEMPKSSGFREGARDPEALKQAGEYYNNFAIAYAKSELGVPESASNIAAIKAYNNELRAQFQSLAGEFGGTIDGTPLADLDDLTKMPAAMQAELQTNPEYSLLLYDKKFQNRFGLKVINHEGQLMEVVPDGKKQDANSVAETRDFSYWCPVNDASAFANGTKAGIASGSAKLHDMERLQAHLLKAQQLAIEGKTAEAQAYLDVEKSYYKTYNNGYLAASPVSDDLSIDMVFDNSADSPRAQRDAATRYAAGKLNPENRSSGGLGAFLDGPKKDIVDQDGNIVLGEDGLPLDAGSKNAHRYGRPKIRGENQKGGVAAFEAALKEHGEAAKTEAETLKQKESEEKERIEQALNKIQEASQQETETPQTKPALFGNVPTLNETPQNGASGEAKQHGDIIYTLYADTFRKEAEEAKVYQKENAKNKKDFSDHPQVIQQKERIAREQKMLQRSQKSYEKKSGQSKVYALDRVRFHKKKLEVEQKNLKRLEKQLQKQAGVEKHKELKEALNKKITEQREARKEIQKLPSSPERNAAMSAIQNDIKQMSEIRSEAAENIQEVSTFKSKRIQDNKNDQDIINVDFGAGTSQQSSSYSSGENSASKDLGGTTSLFQLDFMPKLSSGAYAQWMVGGHILNTHDTNNNTIYSSHSYYVGAGASQVFNHGTQSFTAGGFLGSTTEKFSPAQNLELKNTSLDIGVMGSHSMNRLAFMGKASYNIQGGSLAGEKVHSGNTITAFGRVSYNATYQKGISVSPFVSAQLRSGYTSTFQNSDSEYKDYLADKINKNQEAMPNNTSVDVSSRISLQAGVMIHI